MTNSKYASVRRHGQQSVRDEDKNAAPGSSKRGVE
jgi:hypothetical protein